MLSTLQDMVLTVGHLHRVPQGGRGQHRLQGVDSGALGLQSAGGHQWALRRVGSARGEVKGGKWRLQAAPLGSACGPRGGFAPAELLQGRFRNEDLRIQSLCRLGNSRTVQAPLWSTVPGPHALQRPQK